MNRVDFRSHFNTRGPVVLPVIHVLDEEQTARNIELLLGQGAQGCFLINHDFGVDAFLPIVKATRTHFPDLWLGLNFLGVTGKDAFPVLSDLTQQGCRVDAYWADDARIEERHDDQNEAEEIATIRENGAWNGLYFGGTAFKKQRPVAPENLSLSAARACAFMDVVTTSGMATGIEADTSKIEVFRAAIGDKPMALASGITPENARTYSDVDCFMVATGVSKPGEFHNLDQGLLRDLMDTCKKMGEEG